MKNNKASGADSEDDSDGCGIVEANCEPAMVEGQICSIPYELYDLPDLKGILSIDTWDSFLTDEDRFFLSSFLPDMDQQTFNLTIAELLSGSDLCFGNPVHKFFRKLRGGLYVPKVACCRECLVFVKRKRYYYSLRSYHENMIQTFTDMRRLWDQSRNESGISERLGRNQNLKLPDLNRVSSGHEIFSLHGGSKSVLKARIPKSRILQNHSPNLVCGGENHNQSVPRGFLKVVIKPPSTCLAKDPDVAWCNTLMPIRATSSGISRDETSTLFQGSAYPRTVSQKLECGRVNTVAELPRCVLNQQDTLSIFSETTRKPIRRVKKKEADPSSDDLADVKQQDLVRGFSFSKYFTGQTETTKDSTLRPKNLQKDDNGRRKPLGVLSERNDAHDMKDDHMCSLTYKRRKVQRIRVA